MKIILLTDEAHTLLLQWIRQLQSPPEHKDTYRSIHKAIKEAPDWITDPKRIQDVVKKDMTC